MSTQTMIKIWHECKQTVAHHIFIYYVGSETRSTEGQFNWHTVRNLPFVVKHHQRTWKTGWLNSTYTPSLFLATTKSAALDTTVNMKLRVLVLCWWLLLDGEGVDAAGGHHQHGDEHAELRGVGAPHRGQDWLSLQSSFSSTHKQITKIPQFYLLGKIRQLIVNKIDILLTLD